jgi:hypothetical protein
MFFHSNVARSTLGYATKKSKKENNTCLEKRLETSLKGNLEISLVCVRSPA